MADVLVELTCWSGSNNPDKKVVKETYILFVSLIDLVDLSICRLCLTKKSLIVIMTFWNNVFQETLTAVPLYIW